MTPDTPTDTPSPVWNPIAVRDLVRAAQGLHEHPAELILGQSEAAALQAFLEEQYGDEAPASLESTYYLGLKIRTEDVPSRLAVAGTKAPAPITGHLAPLWADDPDEQPQAA